MTSTHLAISPESTWSWRLTSSRRVLLWACVLLPFLIVALWSLNDGPGLDADDYGQYLMHAQALAEGRPYSDIGYIYSRFRYGLGPQSAPPGLPLTLAIIYKAIGPNLIVMKLTLLCFATAFVLLAGLYFGRYENRLLGFGVALLVGLSPDVAFGSTQLLTDLPFAALLWAVFYIMDMAGPLSARRLVSVTLLGGLAMAFRVPGAVLFPALILFTALRYREHGLRPLVPVLCWVVCLAALSSMLPINRFAVIRFSRVFEWHWAQIIESAKAYWPALFASHLHPFSSPRLNDLFHIVTGVLMLVGLGAWVSKAFNRFGTIFAVSYAGLLLVLPIHGARYLWPLYPFFVFGVLNGIRVIALRFAPARPQRASAAALAFAGVLTVPAMAAAMSEPRRGDLMTLPEVQELVRTLKQDAAAGTVRVLFYKPRSFAWRTGIPAMGAIQGPAPCLISELARGEITHVVGRERSGAETEKDIRALTTSRPDLFREERRTQNFVLYRFAVTPAEATTARANCVPPGRRGSSRR